jgi:transcriptional activator HAC1
MDATMAAMRLQSEQQLTRDCLTGVGACDRYDEGNSPTLEALMTLLWAVQVFEKNRERTPELDAATQIGQEIELDGLFRPRDIRGARGVFPVPGHSGTMKRKSLVEGWRTAFKNDRP